MRLSQGLAENIREFSPNPNLIGLKPFGRSFFPRWKTRATTLACDVSASNRFNKALLRFGAGDRAHVSSNTVADHIAARQRIGRQNPERPKEREVRRSSGTCRLGSGAHRAA